jgi:hypothetical protein
MVAKCPTSNSQVQDENEAENSNDSQKWKDLESTTDGGTLTMVLECSQVGENRARKKQRQAGETSKEKGDDKDSMRNKIK